MKLYYHWWLVLVFLSPLPNGSYPAEKLQEYHEYEDCAKEAEQVFAEVRKQDPEGHYTVVCWNSTEKKI